MFLTELYRRRKHKELMLLFLIACQCKYINDPTIWDVDAVMQGINNVLASFHRNPHMVDFSESAKRDFFWTRLLSRFMTLKIRRASARDCIDAYTRLKDAVIAKWPEDEDGKKPDLTPADMYQVIRAFEA